MTAAGAGYSGTPLPKKLGIKEGGVVALLRAPDGFDATLGDLPAGVKVRRRAQGTNDVVVTLHTRRSDFEATLPKALHAMDVDGGLWVAWPKRASKVPTDMTEDVVREVCLPLGLVDNKVCAIDEVWSGLRVVWRTELRAAKR
ncbi:MAG: DUF3052 domain-containing protein [Acidimicrobiales bacterium]|nr:DUF3052 domain-containing protein [Acidimicrobiales bacterium]